RYADDLIKLQKESGVKVVVTPKDILAEQMKSSDKVVAEFSAKDPLFKEIIESQKKYAKVVMSYLLMNQPDYMIGFRNAFGDPTKLTW
ncbi:MAG: C4-dicarboxylate ABC transporter, partial [Proteobacteria bacterium]|nr:C4-dicarboxylate ABC transporter [Candidatus Fonsibacter sp. PEL4]